MFREAGLSRPKQRALLAVAQAVADGLDLHQLCALEAEDAIGEMTAVSGHRSVDGGSAICCSPPAIPTFSRRATSRCRALSATRSA